MSKGVFNVPIATNEPVLSYAPGTPEREEVLATYKNMYNSQVDVPMYIGSEQIMTDNKKTITPPHDRHHVIGHFSYGDNNHVNQAIDEALKAREAWANMPWEHRVSIFLKAADLLAGPFRAKINAATMIAQSKNVFQAEIDAACELIDFFKFNAEYVTPVSYTHLTLTTNTVV